MPNWCSNTLTISGDNEVLDRLAEAAQKGEFCNTVVPIGEWVYETAIQSWGTKWDITCETPEIDDGVLTMFFDSAWSPPVNVYSALMEMDGIDGVYASYFEPGCDFAGEWEDGDDRYVENIAEEIRKPEDDWDPVVKELNEQYDFSGWYDFEEEEEELSTWMEEGAKAKEAASE